jgi:hypothetical protein
MSRKLNRRNVRQFGALHYVSAIWERLFDAKPAIVVLA